MVYSWYNEHGTWYKECIQNLPENLHERNHVEDIHTH